MIPFTDKLKSIIEKRLGEIPSRELYRLGILSSSVALSLLVLGITAYQVQAIPARISDDINTALAPRPWVRELVVIDGRHVYLRGEVEPGSALENEIAKIRKVPGVVSVTNVVEEVPRLPPHLILVKSDNQLTVGGQMSGELMETAVSHIENIYSHTTLKDQIKIDDRLGRPLWLDGFDESLLKLTPLDRFELHGWRDQVEVSGVAETDLLRRQVGYAIPASLISQVNVVNRIKLGVHKAYSDITIVSDWRGSSISGSVPSTEVRDILAQSARATFRIPETGVDLEVDPTLQGGYALELLADLVPTLADISDLRLESSGRGFVVWGRADDPWTLGKFLQKRNELGLETTMQSEITVSTAGKQASLTLFSDQNRAVVNGVLPTMATRTQLISDIKRILGVKSVVDLTSVEPNVARSGWLGKWPQLLSHLPRTVIGVSVDDGSILVTGNVDSSESLEHIDNKLAELFPDSERLNWLTASTGEN